MANTSTKYTKILNWINPYDTVWGFHVHQELPLEQFPVALVIQKHCQRFLAAHGVYINDADSLKPGYGPHLAYMWELRIEKDPEQTLRKLGLAISFMAINRSNLSAYIHPLMHDKNLDDDFNTEGKKNQGNTLWFGYKVPQYQDFFFKPPRDEHDQIIDTRTSRIISEVDKKELLALGEKAAKGRSVNDPFETIMNGYHIHVDYTPQQETLALEVLEHFIAFLFTEGIPPTDTRIYDPRVNDPHVKSGWEVKFLTTNKEIIYNIGIAVAWLMCNRRGLSVMIHPVTWKDGDIKEELKAHSDYTMFIDEPPELDLSFFTRNLK